MVRSIRKASICSSSLPESWAERGVNEDTWRRKESSMGSGNSVCKGPGAGGSPEVKTLHQGKVV